MAQKYLSAEEAAALFSLFVTEKGDWRKMTPVFNQKCNQAWSAEEIEMVYNNYLNVARATRCPETKKPWCSVSDQSDKAMIATKNRYYYIQNNHKALFLFLETVDLTGQQKEPLRFDSFQFVAPRGVTDEISEKPSESSIKPVSGEDLERALYVAGKKINAIENEINKTQQLIHDLYPETSSHKLSKIHIIKEEIDKTQQLINNVYPNLDALSNNLSDEERKTPLEAGGEIHDKYYKEDKNGIKHKIQKARKTVDEPDNKVNLNYYPIGLFKPASKPASNPASKNQNPGLGNSGSQT